MATIEKLKKILGDILELGNAADSFDEFTPLLGAVPELDSMAVVVLITALESGFGIIFEDDEVSAATFETVGSLSQLIERKLQE